MRKYGKWLLVLGVLAASPAWVSANGVPTGTGSTQTRMTQKQLNQQKAEQVAYALKQARLNGYDFEVEVRGDAVKLEGKVRNVTHRALASNVCRKVAGIQKIQNNLKYVPSGQVQRVSGTSQSGGLMNAAYTTTESSSEIQQVRYSKPGKRQTSYRQASSQQQSRPTQTRRSTPPPIQYEVATELGTQPTDQQVTTEAIETALPVVNLTAASSLDQAKPAGPDNQQVAESIAQQLASIGLIGYDVTARYEDGVAILAGQVDNADQMKAAEYATNMIPDVNKVVNNLTVGTSIAQTAFAPQGGGQVTPAGMNFTPAPMPAPYPNAHPGMMPASMAPGGMGPAPAPMGAAGNYSNPQLPSHAWPAYAQYPNSAAIQYPKQYSASAWPYIGPFYPYPQVPLGWREVSMEWDDGMWQLDFNKKKNAWYWLFAPRNWK